MKHIGLRLPIRDYKEKSAFAKATAEKQKTLPFVTTLVIQKGRGGVIAWTTPVRRRVAAFVFLHTLSPELAGGFVEVRRDRTPGWRLRRFPGVGDARLFELMARLAHLVPVGLRGRRQRLIFRVIGPKLGHDLVVDVSLSHLSAGLVLYRRSVDEPADAGDEDHGVLVALGEGVTTFQPRLDVRQESLQSGSGGRILGTSAHAGQGHQEVMVAREHVDVLRGGRVDPVGPVHLDDHEDRHDEELDLARGQGHLIFGAGPATIVLVLQAVGGGSSPVLGRTISVFRCWEKEIDLIFFDLRHWFSPS